MTAAAEDGKVKASPTGEEEGSEMGLGDEMFEFGEGPREKEKKNDAFLGLVA